MQKLRQMSIFAHVVEAGSISAAAERLGLSKSVVSQHLKSLEQNLGVMLLKRTTRRQSLTSAGLDFYQQCQQMNLLVEQAWAQAQHEQLQPSGKVCITAPHALMDSLVAPAVAELLLKHRDLRIELIANDNQLDLMGNDVDLAVRVGSSGDSNLKQKRIGQFRDVLCGRPELCLQEVESLNYIANHWQAEVIEHKFIAPDTGSCKELRYQAICRANSFHACMALIQHGVGIGLIPEFIFMRQAKLLEVLPGYQLATNNVYVLHPFQGQLPLAVEVCIFAIEEALGKK